MDTHTLSTRPRSAPSSDTRPASTERRGEAPAGTPVTAAPLPHPDTLWRAVAERDTRYEGIFVLAVRTTGIFCRPGCPARTPARRNVDFFRTPKEAMARGFRPCLRCRPMEPRGEAPAPIRALMREVQADPTRRLRDRDLRARGLDPATVRRWFQRHHGMTFQGWQRGLRLAGALGALARGEGVSRAAFGSGYDSLSGFQEALRTLTGRSPSRSRDAMVVHLSQLPTPLGPMLLGATDEAVVLLEFTDRRMLETQLRRLERQLDCVFVPGTPGPGATGPGAALEEELARYFAGELREFTVPLAAPGSDFQQRVWAGLREIPYGETRSYGEQARALGDPKAVRAVARANGDNRIAIVIPCHRVIGADGKLTGYGGGLERKRFLLELEQGRVAGGQTALGL